MLKVANEYWIQDDGDIAYADGDVGDVNHEGYVIQMLLSQHGFDPENGGYNTNDPNMIESYVNDNWDAIKAVLVSQGEWDEAIDVLAQTDVNAAIRDVSYRCTLDDVFKAAGVLPEEIAIMNGSGDARLYAQKNWGWKAVRGVNVETWNLSSKDLAVIAKGLGNIAEQSGMDDYEDETYDPEYNIYVISGGGWFRDIPLSSIEAGDINAVKGGSAMVGGKLVEEVATQRRPTNPYYKYDGD